MMKQLKNEALARAPTSREEMARSLIGRKIEALELIKPTSREEIARSLIGRKSEALELIKPSP